MMSDANLNPLNKFIKLFGDNAAWARAIARSYKGGYQPSVMPLITINNEFGIDYDELNNLKKRMWLEYSDSCLGNLGHDTFFVKLSATKAFGTLARATIVTCAYTITNGDTKWFNSPFGPKDGCTDMTRVFVYEWPVIEFTEDGFIERWPMCYCGNYSVSASVWHNLPKWLATDRWISSTLMRAMGPIPLKCFKGMGHNFISRMISFMLYHIFGYRAFISKVNINIDNSVVCEEILKILDTGRVGIHFRRIRTPPAFNNEYIKEVVQANRSETPEQQILANRELAGKKLIQTKLNMKQAQEAIANQNVFKNALASIKHYKDKLDTFRRIK